MSDMPERAFVLRIKMSADSSQQLEAALHCFADRIARNDVTKGVQGGSFDGAIYELIANGEPTHDEYFKQLDAYLAELTRAKPND